MYLFLLTLHNLLRWIILILILLAIVRALAGMFSPKRFTAADKRIGLFLMIAAHTTFLIGLYQWIAGSWGLQLITRNGMAAVMKDPVYRYWAVEHITGMLVAIVLITIGRSAGKKAISDKAKFTRTFWFYLIALIILLAIIPWPGRPGIGRPLIPGG